MPGFYLALTLSMIMEQLIMPDVPGATLRYITALTFTADFHYTTFFATVLNGPLWSISFEVFSYMLLPMFMSGLFFIAKKRSFSSGIVYWIGVCALILVVNDLVITYCQPDSINRGWKYGLVGGAKYWMPNYNPVGLFAHFMLGIFAFGLMIGIGKNQKLKETLAQKNIFDIVSFLGLLLFAAILVTQTNTPDFGFSIQNQPYYWPFLPLSIALVIAFVTHSKIVGRILDNRFFKYTAKVSFGIYVWHNLIINLSNVGTFYIHDFGRWLGTMSFAIVTSYIIATLSWKFIEKPILDVVHGISRKKVEIKLPNI